MMIPKYRLSLLGKHSWVLARKIFSECHGQAYYCRDGFDSCRGDIFDEVSNRVRSLREDGFLDKDEASLLYVWTCQNVERLMSKVATMEV